MSRNGPRQQRNLLNNGAIVIEINKILFTLIILLIIVIKLLMKYYGNNIKYYLLTVKRLRKLVFELSESVTGQILVFTLKKQAIFYIIKYQVDDLWGIELIINRNYEVGKDLILLTSSKISTLYLDDEIKMDFKNNLNELLDVLIVFTSSNRKKYCVIMENYHAFIFNK